MVARVRVPKSGMGIVCMIFLEVHNGASQPTAESRARCDRHGHELAGGSPAITPERREYVDEGKGA